MSDLQAAFIEPLACVVHAMKRFRILPGESLLILGGGPMGLLLLQALRHNGAAQVVVVEKQPARMRTGAQPGCVGRRGGTGPTRTRSSRKSPRVVSAWWWMPPASRP